MTFKCLVKVKVTVTFSVIVCLCMATLTEVFPCFFLSCMADVRVKPAKTRHGPHSSKFLCCSMYCLFCVVHCIVCVYMCTVLLPKGGYTIAVKYTGCPRRNVPEFGRVFLMLKYTDITQNTYVQSWTVTEIMAREVWNFESCYTLADYQTHIKTGRNMWFL